MPVSESVVASASWARISATWRSWAAHEFAEFIAQIIVNDSITARKNKPDIVGSGSSTNTR
jgi:hypothetical protein